MHKRYLPVLVISIAKWLRPLAVALLCGSAAISVADGNTFFRVINQQGVVELKATITPEEAKRGYSIVTLGGYVVKEVAPELTDEEYARLSAAQKEQRDAEERKLQEQLYDESLLLRYSSVVDLEAERERKLSEFDVRISILRNNLYSLKEKAVTQQTAAADLERRGVEVPEQLSENIADLEAEMKESEAAIVARIEEKRLVGEKYDADSARLSRLLQRAARR
ncbi:MAG: hypothetical protein WBN40_12470 [Pseudomonadales bacterium]